MPRNNLLAPLTVIIVGVVVMGLLLALPYLGADARRQPEAAFMQANQDTSDCASYPNPSHNYVPGRCLTLTAETATASPSPNGTQTATATSTATQTTPETPEATPTSTLAPPPLPPQPLPSASVPEPETPAPQVTPTPPDAPTCAPGEPMLISGEGPPRAAFLLYFGQRAVSGGSVSPDGRFAIPLVVGHERPGVYQVSVRVRGTEEVLRQLTCAVPIPPAPTLPSHRPFSS
jgi:hypothetical protein